MIWNPWHGCIKYSDGCKNCYVYRRDDSIGRDASIINKTNNFYLPLKRNKAGEYKIPSASNIYLSMTSDFFIDKADEWRSEIWDIIRTRFDLKFMIITKRIERFNKCIPDDWYDGYSNVAIACTIENQLECDKRMPIFNNAKIKMKYIICEPLLGRIDFKNYLNKDIKGIIVGGESGNKARICDYEWVLDIRNQAIENNIPFYFKQTGAKFFKNGKIYNVPRKYQHSQAISANINFNYSHFMDF